LIRCFGDLGLVFNIGLRKVEGFLEIEGQSRNDPVNFIIDPD
jgi:hypothetical protein